MFPHFLPTQDVVDLFAFEAGAGRHLLCDRELVRASVARPFVETRF